MWRHVQAGLGDSFHILTPQLPGVGTDARKPFTLQRAADSVSAAVLETGFASAYVCGAGLGAMVALRLAADQPDRVTGLALITRQVRLSPLLMSLPAVVMRLLPATTVERLGAGPDQVIALLNQVRPVDFIPLTPRVVAPVVVICGEHDRINLRASAALARALPHGDFKIIPAAGPDWLTESPLLLTQLLLSAVGRGG